MATTLTFDRPEPMDLEAFLAEADAVVDPEDPESLLAMAPHFARLGANRTFLAERLCAQLRAGGGRRLSQTSASIRLHQTPKYTVRAVAWLPRETTERSRYLDSHVLRYDVAHDHNFSFLTCGYLGPGYETWIFEYDRTSVDRVPGEPIALRFQEHTRLTPGKVMLYRAFRDVHYKAHPPALSVSLNLMTQTRESFTIDQLAVDTRRGIVTGYFGGTTSPMVLLCKLAGALGPDAGPSITAALDELAATHPAWRVRAGALRALTAVDPSAREELSRRAALDAHPGVRALAQDPTAADPIGLDGRVDSASL